MATKVQLARAASALRSTAEVYHSPATALQELLRTLSEETAVCSDTVDTACPADSAPQVAHKQQARKTTDRHQDNLSVLTRQTAAWGQSLDLQQRHNCQSAALFSYHAVPWQVPDQVLQQGLHGKLAAHMQQRQQTHASSSRLCEYSSIPPSRGGSGASSSDSNPSQQAGRTPSTDSPPSPPPDSLAAALLALANSSKTAKLTPSAIAKELDKHIVGQAAAKRAVAVALRNRWRRHRLPQQIAEEITPKNILMIGPTGCGKTEIARRLAKLVEAPFVKVEATKFTELGFVGRDVDEIVKDLMEAALTLTRTRLAQQLREAAAVVVEEILLTALCGSQASPETYKSFRELYRAGDMDETSVEIDLDAISDATAALTGPGAAAALGGLGPSGPAGLGGGLGALADMLEQISRRGHGLEGPGRGGRPRGKTKMKISEARRLLLDAEVERFLSSDRVVKEALRAAQEDGIVFIDEIDKIVDTSKGAGGATSSNVSSEGVQRDLLPILEGSVVATKYGNVSTEHVLFIASGAFHSAKPGDMLAELQGRLPVKVELAGLTAEDFYRILTEPQHNMLRQQQVLLATEGVDLVFTDGAIRAIAKAAEEANKLLDNIGARRLHTVLERVLTDISFEAPEKVAAAKREQQSNSSCSDSQQPSSSVSPPTGQLEGSSRANDATDLLVQCVVTQDMVEDCMRPMLKHIDVSKYML